MDDFRFLKATFFLAGLMLVVTMGSIACGPAAGVPATPGAGSPTVSPVTSPSPGTPGVTVTSTVTLTPGAAVTATTPITGTPSPYLSPGGTPYSKPTDCPNLESRLYALSLASQPQEYARDHNLYYADGRVRVVIDLNSPNGELPAGYDIKEETRNDGLVQALVLLPDLCRLSNEPQVRYVSVPLGPMR